MKLIFFSVLFYVYIPVVMGTIANHAIKNGYVSASPLSYMLVKFRHSSYEEKFLLSLTAIFVIIIPIALYSSSVATDSRIARLLGITMISAAMLISVLYALTSRTVKATYNRYSGWLNLIIAVSATINFSRATSFAEGVITELTGVSASEIPTGLAWLSLIMVPVAWLVTLSIGSIAIYAVALFSTSLKDAPRKSHAVTLQVPIQRRVFRELAAGYAVAFSFAILAVSPLTIVSNVLSSAWAEKKIREELVSASFHVKASKCSIDGIDGAKVAFLNDGKAIVALPHEKLGFVFQPITCATNWMDPAQIIEIYKNGNSAS